MNTLKKNKLIIYAFYFFLYAFIGWCMETLYCVITLGEFHKRGFLYGPICPIYGYGALILILFFSNYKKNSLKLFFYAGIIFSVFEYIVSFLLDATLKLKCWDYTNEFFNLNGRITLAFSIAWGFIAILFINHIHPFIRKKVDHLVKKIPLRVRYTIFNVCFIIFITDTVLSCIKYIKII